MAEAAITFFLERLTNLISDEANLLNGVDEQVQLLQNELEWMRLFIKNADTKRRADPEVRLMVKQIREITFKAEDIIDQFLLKIHQHGRQRIDFDRFTKSIKSCISCTCQLTLLHELGNQLNLINTMSEKISANKTKYCIEASASSNNSNDMSSLRTVRRAPVAEEYDVVGVEDSVKQVKSLLLEPEGHGRRRCNVVSIVGMGGLGKTTLAKKVYNNIDIKRYFDCFAWVSISQEYTLTKILQGIIECVMGRSKEEQETLTEEGLIRELHEYLLQGDKKYLIVLDDIWDIQAWDRLSNAFPVKTNGSRILLTTRNRNVAMHADSSSNNIHPLRFLNKEESWELFCSKIFALRGGTSAQESKCPPELEQLGNEMVGKCGGLPLAIVVLGGILSSKDRTPIAWSKVNVNVNWLLTNGAGSQCSAILALSYYDLPYYLKPCFLYMGLFPEDHEISVTKLFQYWIAEGFVHRRGEETMEEVAEDYMGELIHRSMIQVGKWRYDGRVSTCHVHDLLRDLAIAESEEDQFFQVYESFDDTSKSNSVRRFTIHAGHYDVSNKDKHYFSQYRYTLSIRSLICFGINCAYKQFWTSICREFKLLNVLQLDLDRRFKSIPEAIGELVHLKYLGITPSFINPNLIVPSSIHKLVNLQTLILKNCSLECTPSQIWSLRQLRHLYVTFSERRRSCWNGRFTSQSSHFEIDNLPNLQTLCLSSYYGLNSGKLGRLRMLKKLTIDRITPTHMEEFFDSITRLTTLRSLKLYNSEGFPAFIQFSSNSYLTKLKLIGRLSSKILFPPNLIKLFLRGSKVKTELIVQVLAELRNLKFLVLHFNSSIGKKMIFPQGGFLRLQVLQLCDLAELEELIVEEGALASLTHLKIDGCRGMEMLPDGLRQLSTLQELKLCHMLEKFIARLSENEGGDWEKIKHIPSVIIEHTTERNFKQIWI